MRNNEATWIIANRTWCGGMGVRGRKGRGEGMGHTGKALETQKRRPAWSLAD